MTSELERAWARGARASGRDEARTSPTSSMDDDRLGDEPEDQEVERANEHRRRNSSDDYDGGGRSGSSEREDAYSATSHSTRNQGVVSPATAMAARTAYSRSPPGISAREQQNAAAGGATGGSSPGASTAAGAGASGVYPNGSVMAALAASTERNLQGGMTRAQLFKAQLKYQSAVNGDQAKEKDFKAEVIVMTEPMVFGFATGGGSTEMQLLHSIGTYSRPMSGDTPKLVGFVGERDAAMQLHPALVSVPTEKAWKWKQIKASYDGTEAEQYFSTGAGQANPDGFWSTSGAGTPSRVNEKLPLMLYLPNEAAEYAGAASRTGFEMYKYFVQYAADSDGEIEEEDISLAKKFCLALCQAGATSNKDSSLLAMEMTTIHTRDAELHRWRLQRLDYILGPANTAANQAPVPHTPVRGNGGMQPQAAASPGVNDAMVMASLLAQSIGKQLKPIARAATKSSAALAEQKVKLNEGKKYTTEEMAWLLGWCNVTEIRRLPKIWGKLATSNKSVLHRKWIKDELVAWGVDKGFEILRSVYIDKNTLEDIIALRFSYYETVPTLEGAERGLSVLWCVQRNMEAVADAQARDRAAEATTGTRQLAEQLTLQASDPRPPPYTMDGFKKMVATFAGLLAVLCSEHCPYYKNVLAIRQELDSEASEQLTQYVKPTAIAQHTWAIMCDGRRFFSQQMREEDARRGRTSCFATSHLHMWLPMITSGMNINLPSFPEKWRYKPNPDASRPPAGGGGSGGGNGGGGSRGGNRGGGSDRGGGQPLPPFGGARNQPEGDPPRQWQNTNQGNPQGGNNDRLAHMNEGLRQDMRQYHAKFGNEINITKILDAARIRQGDLPWLNAFYANGRNTMCHNHVLGVCRYGARCTFRHPHKHEIPNNYARDLYDRVRPGIEALLNPQQGGGGGGRNNDRHNGGGGGNYGGGGNNNYGQQGGGGNQDGRAAGGGGNKNNNNRNVRQRTGGGQG